MDFFKEHFFFFEGVGELLFGVFSMSDFFSEFFVCLLECLGSCGDFFFKFITVECFDVLFIKDGLGHGNVDEQAVFKDGTGDEQGIYAEAESGKRKDGDVVNGGEDVCKGGDECDKSDGEKDVSDLFSFDFIGCISVFFYIDDECCYTWSV